MARKKTITKDQILNAAYDLVASEGFAHFTARSIAAKMKCSTQPIYLEFQNMDDLRQELIKKIEDYLQSTVFMKEVIGDPLIDMHLNYIAFAKNQKTLYRALFVEEHPSAREISRFAYEIFEEHVSEHPQLKQLDEELKKALFTSTWIVSSGIASLVSSNLIHPTQEETIQIIQTIVDDVVKEKKTPYIIKNTSI